MFDDIVALMPYATIMNLSLALIGIYIAIKFRLPCYHPLVLFQFYFFAGYALRPLAISLDGGSIIWDRIGINLSLYDGVQALVVGFIFWIFFTLTSIYITLKSVQIKNHLIPPHNTKLEVKNKNLFNILCYLMIIVGMAVTWKMIAGRGDSIYAFQTEVDSMGKQKMVGESGYFTMMAEWPIIGILLLLLKQGLDKKTGLVLILFFLLRIYVGAQRLSFIAIAIMLCFYLLIQSRRTWPPVKFIAPAMAILFIFNFVGSDRLLLQRVAEGRESPMALLEAKETGTSALSEHTGHFAEFDVLCNVVKVVPEPLGYNYFCQYLRIFIWPIPRQIWNDKPVVTSLVNFSKLGNFYALTTSSIGDSYTNLGTWGTWIMACVWSFLLTTVYCAMCSTKNKSYIMILFFAICGYISTVFRDGGVTSIYFILVTIVPAYLIIFICRPVKELKDSQKPKPKII